MKYSYSSDWLSNTLDFPTILKNFIYLFGFSNTHMLLNFPSFRSHLGGITQLLTMEGKDNYQTGPVFTSINQASLLQTAMYEQYLRQKGVELEDVLVWFFDDYIADEFGARGLKFSASSPTASFLERARHLFAEMESVLKQFTLYVRNGYLDRDLLTMSSEQLSYGTIPSLADGKYVYASKNPEILRIQHLLFSDQSLMGYIDVKLRERTFAELMFQHAVYYEDFADHQKSDLDFLIHHHLVDNTNGQPLAFKSMQQFLVLSSLNSFEAASYFHYPAAAQSVIGGMEKKGWVERKSSLLTIAESSFFNFMLNQSEFSNGPDLRNRYLHGSQPDGDDNRVHYTAYVQALRLLVSLVIKINDDFEIHCAQGQALLSVGSQQTSGCDAVEAVATEKGLPRGVQDCATTARAIGAT
jgi:hypothetical protein